MAEQSAVFAWYELLTTDISAAQAFYGKVVGWDVQDASTAQFAYRLFSVGDRPVAGLMELPLDGRNKGATPRWAGYVAVEDVDGVADQLKRLGGTVYVPPTDSNIGRLAVVADPQTATLALIGGLKYRRSAAEPGGPGHVCWRELYATDAKEAFEFYRSLLGWENEAPMTTPIESYQLFGAGGRAMGGMFNKIASAPVPFWLYYFEVADLDLAVRRVRTEGGHITRGPIELWGDIGFAHCIDSQGAVFALQGNWTGQAEDPQAAAQIGWSTKWGDINSRGRLLETKPKRGRGR
jgi:hypothetical protein